MRQLDREDAEDFGSWTRLRLLDQDAAILRAFAGRSSWRTYLTRVIRNLYRDWLDSVHGKWRPSVTSQRLGPLAVELDRLLNRDGLSLLEALEVLRRSAGRDHSVRSLARLAAQVPHRPHRRFQALAAVGPLPATRPTPEEALVQREAAARQQARLRQVERAIQCLEPEDALLLRLRYFEEMRVSDIARTLGCPQKPLYRRLERCLATLRKDLTAPADASKGSRSDSGQARSSGCPVNSCTVPRRSARASRGPRSGPVEPLVTSP